MSLGSLLGRLRATGGATRAGPIGVEFSLERMNLVQMARTEAGALAVRAAASVDYPCGREELLASPKRLKAALAQALKASAFTGRRIVTCLPPGETRTLSVTYSVGPERDTAAAIHEVLDGRLEGPVADYVIDYMPVRARSTEGPRLAIVAVARRERVFAFLDTLRKSGVQIEALEIGPAAIKRLVGEMIDVEKGDNVLVVNFGTATSYVTVLSGRRLLLDQEIEFGEQPMLERLSGTLEMEPAAVRAMLARVGLDARFDPRATDLSMTGKEHSATMLEITKPLLLKLVSELKRAILYLAAETRGNELDQVYLMGSLARWRGVDRVLRKMLDAPVDVLPDPISRFGRADPGEGDARRGGGPELAVATGLALRGMTSDD